MGKSSLHVVYDRNQTREIDQGVENRELRPINRCFFCSIARSQRSLKGHKRALMRSLWPRSGPTDGHWAIYIYYSTQTETSFSFPSLPIFSRRHIEAVQNIHFENRIIIRHTLIMSYGSISYASFCTSIHRNSTWTHVMCRHRFYGILPPCSGVNRGIESPFLNSATNYYPSHCDARSKRNERQYERGLKPTAFSVYIDITTACTNRQPSLQTPPSPHRSS